MEFLKWLNYTWIVASKWTKDYKDKQGKDCVEYNLKVWVVEDFSFIQTKCSQEIYDKVWEQRKYTFPVWFRTFAYWDKKVWTFYFVRKWDVIDNDTWEIV